MHPTLPLSSATHASVSGGLVAAARLQVVNRKW